jgi:hypothetical protein
MQPWPILFIDCAIKKKEAILFSISKALKLAALPLALFGASAAFAETIVVRSNGPSAKSYPPGKSLPGSANVALKAGDTVTILDASGTRVLKGPGNFALASARTATTGSTFGQFLRSTGAKQGRTGATRGPGVTASSRSPNIWFVDISKSGAMCIADPTGITLWRPQTAKAQSYTLTNVSDGKSASVAFAAAQASRPWPVEDLPVKDGAQYRLSGGGMATPASITMRSVTPKATSPESIGATLIKNSCNAQIELLVQTTALPAEES